MCFLALTSCRYTCGGHLGRFREGGAVVSGRYRPCVRKAVNCSPRRISILRSRTTRRPFSIWPENRNPPLSLAGIAFDAASSWRRRAFLVAFRAESPRCPPDCGVHTGTERLHGGISATGADGGGRVRG